MTPRDEDTGTARPLAAGAVKAAISRISGNPTWKWLSITALAGSLPFCVWLVGTAVSWVAPPSFQSSALVKIDTPTLSPAEVAAEMRSEEVMREAVRLLASGPEGRDANPMSTYLLSTSLYVEPKGGPDVVRVEARSEDAGDARRMVLAVVEAYGRVQKTSGFHPRVSCFYVDPAGMTPDRVSDETRMALGLGGLAGLGLLLAIPLLEGVERALPLRRAVAGLPTTDGQTV